MIQPADVLVENSIAFFIRNGFLIYTVQYLKTIKHADDRGEVQYIQKGFEYLLKVFKL